MNAKSISLAVLFLVLAKTGGLISTGEKIIKVVDFPDTPEFQMQDGEYVDAGYRYKQLKILYMPVWSYGGTWCGYIGVEGIYLDVSKEQLDEVASSIGLTLPEAPALAFWEQYGGILALSTILIFLMLILVMNLTGRRNIGKETGSHPSHV